MDAFKFYEVGGKVRDELLGLTSKDVDYVAVPNKCLLESGLKAEEMFEELENYLFINKFEVFLITKECYTIRAKFPEGHKYSGTADFVMARKEVGYIEGTRTPIVEPGNLYDDLSRRDFTVNALARDPDTGEIIDFFNGMHDLKEKVLRTPLNPEVTFDDDPLRILRCIRFAITKGFHITTTCWELISDYNYEQEMGVVSEQRIRDELFKCFKHDSNQTIKYLSALVKLRDYIFTRTNLWLKPTNEK